VGFEPLRVGFLVFLPELGVNFQKFVYLLGRQDLSGHHLSEHDVSALWLLGVGMESDRVHNEGNEHVVDDQEACVQVFELERVGILVI